MNTSATRHYLRRLSADELEELIRLIRDEKKTRHRAAAVASKAFGAHRGNRISVNSIRERLFATPPQWRA
jgi:hypothetical protein